MSVYLRACISLIRRLSIQGCPLSRPLLEKFHIALDELRYLVRAVLESIWILLYVLMARHHQHCIELAQHDLYIEGRIPQLVQHVAIEDEWLWLLRVFYPWVVQLRE